MKRITTAINVEEWEKGGNYRMVKGNIDIPYEVEEKLYKQSVEILEKQFNISAEDLRLGVYDHVLSEKLIVYAYFVYDRLGNEWAVNKIINDIVGFTGTSMKEIMASVETIDGSKFDLKMNRKISEVDDDNLVKIHAELSKVEPKFIILMLLVHAKSHVEDSDNVAKSMEKLKIEIDEMM